MREDPNPLFSCTCIYYYYLTLFVLVFVDKSKTFQCFEIARTHTRIEIPDSTLFPKHPKVQTNTNLNK